MLLTITAPGKEEGRNLELKVTVIAECEGPHKPGWFFAMQWLFMRMTVDDHDAMEVCFCFCQLDRAADHDAESQS